MSIHSKLETWKQRTEGIILEDKARYFQKVELNKIGGVVFFKKTDTRLYFEYNELGHIYIGYIVI